MVVWRESTDIYAYWPSRCGWQPFVAAERMEGENGVPSPEKDVPRTTVPNIRFNVVRADRGEAYLTPETNLPDSFGYRFWVS